MRCARMLASGGVSASWRRFTEPTVTFAELSRTSLNPVVIGAFEAAGAPVVELGHCRERCAESYPYAEKHHWELRNFLSMTK